MTREDFPELEGTEKQIKWADELRNEAFIYLHSSYADIIETMIKNETKAEFWINLREVIKSKKLIETYNDLLKMRENKENIEENEDEEYYNWDMVGTEKQVKWANDIINKTISSIKERGEKQAKLEQGYENSILNQIKIDTTILGIMRCMLSAHQIISARFEMDTTEPIEGFCEYYNIDYNRALLVKYTDAQGNSKKYFGRLDSEPSEQTDKEIEIIAAGIFNYIFNALMKK